MSWSAAVTAIKARMAAGFSAWPVSWPNEHFPEPRDDGGKPINPDGTPKAFVECEVIGGTARMQGIGLPGERLTVQPGLIRAYLAAPRGTGLDDLNTQADAIAALFNRAEFGSTVRCQDASVQGDVFAESGNYALIMVSIPFDLYDHR
jgi:hypothetical protein